MRPSCREVRALCCSAGIAPTRLHHLRPCAPALRDRQHLVVLVHHHRHRHAVVPGHTSQVPVDLRLQHQERCVLARCGCVGSWQAVGGILFGPFGAGQQDVATSSLCDEHAHTGWGSTDHGRHHSAGLRNACASRNAQPANSAPAASTWRASQAGLLRLHASGTCMAWRPALAHPARHGYPMGHASSLLHGLGGAAPHA